MASNAEHSPSRTAPDPPRLAGQFAIVVGSGGGGGGGGGGTGSVDSFDGALLAASAAMHAFAAKHCHRQLVNASAAPSVDSYIGTASMMRDVCAFWSEAPPLAVVASGMSLFARGMCSEFRSQL